MISKTTKHARTRAIRRIIVERGPITSAGIREAMLDIYGRRRAVSEMTSREIAKHINAHLLKEGVVKEYGSTRLTYRYGGQTR